MQKRSTLHVSSLPPLKRCIATPGPRSSSSGTEAERGANCFAERKLHSWSSALLETGHLGIQSEDVGHLSVYIFLFGTKQFVISVDCFFWYVVIREGSTSFGSSETWIDCAKLKVAIDVASSSSLNKDRPVN